MIDVMNQEISESVLAEPVGPEDIRPGDYIAPMNEFGQFVLRGCDADWRPDAPPRLHLVRVRLVDSTPTVMRVLEVAMPFVLVLDQHGGVSLVTCRLAEFARLPEALGRRAFRDVDRRHREEARKRRKQAAERRERRDQPGAGASGAD
ncbi:MAG TPA: hypothetical protein VHC70_06040 [Phycisphaerales bacterium]|nr:hypothetical protein [Phycisphaerales bacterium]